MSHGDKHKMKIKKGDTVQVSQAGKNGGDRASRARSSRSTRETQRVLVEGVNRVTKHTKAGQTARGTRTGGLVHTRPRSTSATWPWSTPTTRSRPAVKTRVETVERDGRPKASAPASRCAPVRTCDDDDRDRSTTDHTTRWPPRLKARYQAEIKGALLEQFGYENVMQVPGVVKVVVNMGVGDAARDASSSRAPYATSRRSPARSRS